MHSPSISGAQSVDPPRLTTRFPSFRIAPVDDLQPFLLSPLDGFDVVPFRFLDGRGEGFVDGFVGESDDLRFGEGVFGGLEFGGVLFADDEVGGEVREEEGRDESLTSVIRDLSRIASIFNPTSERRRDRTGDGRFILLRHSAAPNELILDFLREERSFQYGGNGHFLLAGEGGRHPGRWRRDGAKQER